MEGASNMTPADQLKFEGMLLGLSFRELSQLLEPKKQKAPGPSQPGGNGGPLNLAALLGGGAPQGPPSPISQLATALPQPAQPSIPFIPGVRNG